jgi:endonuclease G
MYFKNVFVTAAIGAALILSAACTKEYCDINPANEKAPVLFESNINSATPITRASAWSDGSTIGIFMINDAVAVVDDMTNKQYVTDGTAAHAFTPATTSDTIFYPVNGNSVNFISYYPYQAGLALTDDYAVNVVNQQNAIDIDLLYVKTTGTAYSKATQATPVSLHFGHQLSHWVLNTKPASGLTAADLEGMTVTVKGLNTQVKFNLSSMALSDLSVVDGIALKVVTSGKQFEAILIPQAIGSDQVTVEFTTVKNETFVWKVPASALETNKEYTYNVTISRTGISVTGEIEDWETGVGGDVSAN